jgi:L-alanine-DL-glutamate epimerase-like enolase superfamily enzyme
MDKNFIISEIKVSIVKTQSAGADYTDHAEGHWINDTIIANPMSKYPEFQESRSKWGMNAIKGIFIEISTEGGHTGFATAYGGYISSWIIKNHFNRFLIGADARDLNLLYDQMYRASIPYSGQNGIVINTIAGIDLALWDLLGKIRNEPVYKMIGGKVRDKLQTYVTGPQAKLSQDWGHVGSKIPLPYGPGDGIKGLKKNQEYIMETRKQVGPDYRLMIDCYMALDVPYTIDLTNAVKEANLDWIEEALPPHDLESHKHIKRACPWQKFATGEHTNSRYGFRKIIEDRSVDILQPDLTLCGMTETLRIAAMASAYDITVIPHCSGIYAYNFGISSTATPFNEFINLHPTAEKVVPIFGGIFTNEPVPINGEVTLTDLPGFGAEFNDEVELEEI